MKKNTILYIVLGITILTIIVILIVRNTLGKVKPYSKVPNDTSNDSTSTSFSLSSCADASIDKNKVLQIGVKGCEVVRLQSALNVVMKNAGLSFTPLAIDGIFGSKTDSALANLTGAHRMTLTQWQDWVSTSGL